MHTIKGPGGMQQGMLHGKTAVVTGSATGIGAAVAVALSEAGANVVVNYTRSGAEAEATARLAENAGVDVRLVQAASRSDVP